jgi:transcriptional regulator with XRE-family HTH domain/KaiC/GvpD/RAD55 family RecA-like ATPase|uniref:Cupin domain-containing protein n=1 Tax=Desulfobacca acetoxidans TaxID=60893 RepID=A0A7C3Z1W2_9BACT
MTFVKQRVPSGVNRLDLLLGGLFIGDNVVWHDDAGSLAPIFCHHFIKASEQQGRAIIYVCFDRSPKSLLEKLGPLAEYPKLTLLDCFTSGKGKEAGTFVKFYEEADLPCRVVKVQKPQEVREFENVLYQTHSQLSGDVRLIFESVTGMQELWGGEERFLDFYAHSCPRLYDLNTIAYWTLAKHAHSQRFRAAINQIAQVAIELTIKRGTTSLTILKAEQRSPEEFDKPHVYWTRDQAVVFEEDRRTSGKTDLGLRLKEFRRKRGVSQAELAKMVGVTASTISQIEGNLIYPSLPALLKIAEVLAVEVTSFFEGGGEGQKRLVFTPQDAVAVKLRDLPEGAAFARLLHPVDVQAKAEPYLIEIPPKQTLPGHFFFHKGEEVGYVLAGRLQVQVGQTVHTLKAGDVIYLTSEIPTEWKNPSPSPARLFWVNLK